ncbi:MAG: hypothetical protein S0880_20740 [Actinomycetota bacterium]|nr:hypothetical protein [Actinomycetota bacterium]
MPPTRRTAGPPDAPWQQARIGRAIADSYRSMPQTSDDEALASANAVAMTEAEPW